MQAGWIALSGGYPMAFDEDFHLGIIRLYAHHLSPFWSSHPSGAEVFGAVTRDPSYLYHWLMSFPYRLTELFTHNLVAQVLILRALNIGLFAAGLVFYRRLLAKTGTSMALVHGCLLALVLLPVVPLLAAQINYDNLFVPAVGLCLLLTVNFTEELRSRRGLNAGLLMAILIACLLTSLIKYAFLPILLAIVFYLAYWLYKIFPTPGKAWAAFWAGVKAVGRWRRAVLILGVATACALFGGRYGVNTLRYHTPVPDCRQVLSVKQCSAYGPWIRDYTLSSGKTGPGAHDNPLAFSGEWFYGMWLRLFFSIGGPATDFDTRGPLAVPAVSAIVLAAAAVISGVAYLPKILKRYNSPVLVLFGLVTFSYVAALWLDEYRAYLRTGQPVAINGRYLLPVLPLVMVFGALAYAQFLRRKPRLKLALAGVVIAGLLWGGGALTFILRSNDSWLWQNSPVRHANYSVRNTIGPLVPGYYSPNEFLR